MYLSYTLKVRIRVKFQQLSVIFMASLIQGEKHAAPKKNMGQFELNCHLYQNSSNQDLIALCANCSGSIADCLSITWIYDWMNWMIGTL